MPPKALPKTSLSSLTFFSRKKTQVKDPHDLWPLGKRLIVLVFTLLGIGLFFVFVSSTAEALSLFDDRYFFIRKQIQWAVIGLAVFAVTVHVPRIFWLKTAKYWYILGILLLLAVFIPGLGSEVKGASRWLSLGGFTLQPVEVMKLGIILYFAEWLSRHQRLSPFLTFALFPTTLILLQPDLGSTLIVLGISFCLFFAAGGKNQHLYGLIGAGVLGIVILIAVAPYRLARVTTYLNPESDPLGAGYHIRQITLALGNGGWIGKGLGQSKQKYQYIPEVSTDSIFAILAEETGFIGSLILIGLFIFFIRNCFEIAQKQTDPFFRLVCVGCAIWLSAHIVLNLGAVVALFPLTGVPLPFISRGGSSLVTVMIATGILVSATRPESGPHAVVRKTGVRLKLP